MGNTIRAERGYPRLLVVAATLVLGLAVASLAWPRFAASFRYLPVDIAIARYHADQEIPRDRLTVLIGFAEEAIGRYDHYRYHNGLSLLHYLRALDPYTPALERRPAYRHSLEEAVASLRQAPAQPAAWLRVATIRWILHDEPETVLAPWKMSIFTGRISSTLFGHRVAIGLAYLPYLDDEARAMLRDQMLLAWRLRPGELVAVLAQRDPGLAAARALVGETDPLALSEMEAWVEKVR